LVHSISLFGPAAPAAPAAADFRSLVSLVAPPFKLDIAIPFIALEPALIVDAKVGSNMKTFYIFDFSDFTVDELNN
jgi:hypothetical protein